MLNYVWFFLLGGGLFWGMVNGRVKEITAAIIEYSQTAVELSLGMIAIMTLWLGIMKIAEESGLINLFAKIVRPVMVRLFPEVPPDHPAMGAMMMNISANILGLDNAATPFGIKAMKELQKLNKDKESASNAMCMFLGINTSSVTLVASGIISYRVAAGSQDPTVIIGPMLVATTVSTLVAIIAAKFMEKVTKPKLP
ncbi:MAG: spore maturation protein [Sporomusaceae bacterium]|jgi:spore maturation protein A|nr:spore maturation protein [Sporomusaceae bacterium]